MNSSTQFISMIVNCAPGYFVDVFLYHYDQDAPDTNIHLTHPKMLKSTDDKTQYFFRGFTQQIYLFKQKNKTDLNNLQYIPFEEQKGQNEILCQSQSTLKLPFELYINGTDGEIEDTTEIYLDIDHTQIKWMLKGYWLVDPQMSITCNFFSTGRYLKLFFFNQPRQKQLSKNYLFSQFTFQNKVEEGYIFQMIARGKILAKCKLAFDKYKEVTRFKIEYEASLFNQIKNTNSNFKNPKIFNNNFDQSQLLFKLDTPPNLNGGFFCDIFVKEFSADKTVTLKAIFYKEKKQEQTVSKFIDVITPEFKESSDVQQISDQSVTEITPNQQDMGQEKSVTSTLIIPKMEFKQENESVFINQEPLEIKQETPLEIKQENVVGKQSDFKLSHVQIKQESEDQTNQKDISNVKQDNDEIHVVQIKQINPNISLDQTILKSNQSKFENKQKIIPSEITSKMDVEKSKITEEQSEFNQKTKLKIKHPKSIEDEQQEFKQILLNEEIKETVSELISQWAQQNDYNEYPLMNSLFGFRQRLFQAMNKKIKEIQDKEMKKTQEMISNTFSQIDLRNIQSTVNKQKTKISLEKFQNELELSKFKVPAKKLDNQESMRSQIHLKERISQDDSQIDYKDDNAVIREYEKKKQPKLISLLRLRQNKYKFKSADINFPYDFETQDNFKITNEIFKTINPVLQYKLHDEPLQFMELKKDWFLWNNENFLQVKNLNINSIYECTPLKILTEVLQTGNLYKVTNVTIEFYHEMHISNQKHRTFSASVKWKNFKEKGFFISLKRYFSPEQYFLMNLLLNLETSPVCFAEIVQEKQNSVLKIVLGAPTQRYTQHQINKNQGLLSYKMINEDYQGGLICESKININQETRLRVEYFNPLLNNNTIQYKYIRKTLFVENEQFIGFLEVGKRIAKMSSHLGCIFDIGNFELQNQVTIFIFPNQFLFRFTSLYFFENKMTLFYFINKDTQGVTISKEIDNQFYQQLNYKNLNFNVVSNIGRPKYEITPYVKDGFRVLIPAKEYIDEKGIQSEGYNIKIQFTNFGNYLFLYLYKPIHQYGLYYAIMVYKFDSLKLILRSVHQKEWKSSTQIGLKGSNFNNSSFQPYNITVNREIMLNTGRSDIKWIQKIEFSFQNNTYGFILQIQNEDPNNLLAISNLHYKDYQFRLLLKDVKHLIVQIIQIIKYLIKNI